MCNLQKKREEKNRWKPISSNRLIDQPIFRQDDDWGNERCIEEEQKGGSNI